MNHKGFTTVIVAPVFIVAGGVYYAITRTTPAPSVTPPTPSTTAPGVVTPTGSATDASTWKTYQSARYGLEFKYPSDFKLEEQTANLGSTEDITCPNVFRVSLTNPNAPNVQFEAGGPLLERSITIDVRKASCFREDDSGITLHSNVVTSLVAGGFSRKMSGLIAMAIPFVGNYPNGPSGQVVWADECSVGPVAQTRSITYIKSRDCLLDSGLSKMSVALIPSRTDNFFLEMQADENFYDEQGSSYIDGILDSFILNNSSR